MKIGIELRQVAVGPSGGLAQHLQGMLQAAFRRYPQHQFSAFTTIFSRSVLGPPAANAKVITIPRLELFQRIDQAADAGEIDVLFRSFPMDSALKMPWEKQVVMVPDLQHELLPEFFEPRTLAERRMTFNIALARAGALVTCTDFVRRTIAAHEWTCCRDIFLAPPSTPLGREAPPSLSLAELANIPTDDFFLYPANLWPHKNHPRVFAALQRLIQRIGRQIHLILTGHPEGWPALRARFPDLPVTHLGFVREPLLKALLSKARALAFFSMHEGFGIPLLEAFAAGTPVICSNTTSLPEVGGDAVFACDPADIEAISQTMERILADDALRSGLIQQGKARLAHYSWEASADGFIQACEHVAKSDGATIQIAPAPPLVTVVTPSYNQGRFLKATIESVLTQSYPHIQYLVLDGGSDDESVDILKSYGDRFFWKSGKDGGQAVAINDGMAMAKGQIRAFLNSDDVLLPGALQRVVDHFREHPECDMVYGRADYIDAQGNTTGVYRTDDYSFQRLMHDCCVCQPAAFWQSRIAGLIGPFDASLHMAFDYDYWLRIDRAGGRIQHIRDRLAQSRLYPDTKTLSLRGTSYRETFAVCLKHGGYVDYNYFKGLWHHRVTEVPTGWPRHFRFAPGLFLALAWAHHQVFEARRKGMFSSPRRIVNPLISGLIRLPLAGKALARVMNRLRPTLAPPPRVQGFLSGDWMQPQSQVLVKPKAAGQTLRHVGMAPLDMQVTIKADDKILGTYLLIAGKVQAIGEDIRIEGPRPVRLRFLFSNYTVDSANRRLSFLVIETNLFDEDDLR